MPRWRRAPLRACCQPLLPALSSVAIAAGSMGQGRAGESGGAGLWEMEEEEKEEAVSVDGRVGAWRGKRAVGKANEEGPFRAIDGFGERECPWLRHPNAFQRPLPPRQRTPRTHPHPSRTGLGSTVRKCARQFLGGKRSRRRKHHGWERRRRRRRRKTRKRKKKAATSSCDLDHDEDAHPTHPLASQASHAGKDAFFQRALARHRPRCVAPSVPFASLTILTFPCPHRPAA